MRLLAALGCALALSACATPQVETAHQTSEKALIFADDLYIAIASFANAQEMSGGWTADKGEGVKREAYNALLTARAAYKAGNVVSTAALAAIAAQNAVPAPGGQ